MFEYPGNALDTFWGLRSHSSGVIVPGFTNSRIPSFWECTHNSYWRGQVFKLTTTRRRLPSKQRILLWVFFRDACALPWASLVVEKFLIAARCIPCPRVTSVEAEAWRLSVVINTTQQSVHVQRERRRSMNMCTCQYSDYWEGGRFQGVVSSWDCHFLVMVFLVFWLYTPLPVCR